MANCVGFKAVACDDARALVLGTLPGTKSLKCGEYYANKGNSFWKIIGELTGISPDLPYEDRLRRLGKSGIALWDVCASAERVGALDAKIQFKTIVPNDFSSFFEAYKRIELICFNGNAAEQLFCRKALVDLPPAAKALRREVLPSTSPAFASMRFEEKLSRWREALCQVLHCQT